MLRDDSTATKPDRKQLLTFFRGSGDEQVLPWAWREGVILAQSALKQWKYIYNREKNMYAHKSLE